MYDYFQLDKGRNDNITLKSFRQHVNTCSQSLKYLLKIDNTSDRYNQRYVILNENKVHLSNAYLSGNICRSTRHDIPKSSNKCSKDSNIEKESPTVK